MLFKIALYSQSDSIQLQHNYSDYSLIKAGISPEISTQNTVLHYTHNTLNNENEY